MDVNQIKKINEMSKTLRTHGFAQHSTDGSALAASMEERPLPGAGMTGTPSSLTRDDVELLLERLSRKFMQRIEQLEERLAKIESRPVSSSPIQVREVKIQSAQDGGEVPQVSMPNTNKKDTSKPRLRSDPEGMNPDDFSVEKMFYYGNKR